MVAVTAHQVAQRDMRQQLYPLLLERLSRYVLAVEELAVRVLRVAVGDARTYFAVVRRCS